MTKRLPRAFFSQDTHAVATNLLGKVLLRRWRGQVLSGRITEVECYIGENDKACHAAKGRTPRTEVMFGAAGHAYVYLVYGMYYCLNVVTEEVDFPAAVLIRGLMSGQENQINGRAVRKTAVPRLKQSQRFNAGKIIGSPWQLNGPGKLCRAMYISRVQNGEDLTVSNKLWLVDDGYCVAPNKIISTPRIGVAYAGKDALLPWRYLIKDVA